MYRVFIQSTEKVSPTWVHYTETPLLTPVDLCAIAISANPDSITEVINAKKSNNLERIILAACQALTQVGYTSDIKFHLIRDTSLTYALALHTFRMISGMLENAYKQWVNQPTKKADYAIIHQAIEEECATHIHTWAAIYNLGLERLL